LVHLIARKKRVLVRVVSAQEVLEEIPPQPVAASQAMNEYGCASTVKNMSTKILTVAFSSRKSEAGTPAPRASECLGRLV